MAKLKIRMSTKATAPRTIPVMHLPLLPPFLEPMIPSTTAAAAGISMMKGIQQKTSETIPQIIEIREKILPSLFSATGCSG